MAQMAKLESTINFIRDVLRKEGITGLESINHCIVFIMCRMLNEELCDKFKINKKFAFENIIIDADGEEVNNQELYERIYVKGYAKECLVGELSKKLGFNNIKFKLVGLQNLSTIINKLKKVDVDKLSSEFDLIGTIYEFHLKSGTSNSMRDLGQYYTNRQIIKYMIELCDPKMINGKIESIVDPTMGTGGFLTMAIKYLNDKYENIKWNKNKDNIHGFDIDENVKNMALMNVFLEIGELCSDTIIKQDTLHFDMKNKGVILENVDVILANEPMGLKNIVYSDCCERIKELKIRGTKAEPLFLHLFMQSLNEGGRCAVIVPDGMLFNESKQHNETRKYLMKNFNLKKVVSLNDDFFLNTGVKTSILFFVNDEYMTSKVEFSEIKLKDGKIDETIIIKVKMSKIKENGYSLFINRYNSKPIEKMKNIEYVKLSKLLTKIPGRTLPKNSMVEGKYPVIAGGASYGGFHNEFNCDDDLIFIARVGTAGHVSTYKGKCFVTDLVGAYKCISKMALLRYIYYYLKLNEDYIKENYVFKTGAPSINLSFFSDKFEIPIPSIEIQNLIAEQLNDLDEGIEMEKQLITKYNNYIKYYMMSATYHEKECKLKDVCQRCGNGKTNSNEVSMTGEYPFYAARNMNPCGIHKTFDFSGKKYLLFAKSGGNQHNKINEHTGIGKFWLVCGKSAGNVAMIKFEIKMDGVSYEYLNYYFKSILHKIQNIAYYTTGNGNINMNELNEFDIPIPSIEKQNEIVKYCDNLTNIIDTLKLQIDDKIVLMKNILDTYLNSEN